MALKERIDDLFQSLLTENKFPPRKNVKQRFLFLPNFVTILL